LQWMEALRPRPPLNACAGSRHLFRARVAPAAAIMR